MFIPESRPSYRMHDLRDVYQPHFTRAFAVAVFIHLLVIGILWSGAPLWTTPRMMTLELLPFPQQEIIAIRPVPPNALTQDSEPDARVDPEPAPLLPEPTGAITPVPDRAKADSLPARFSGTLPVSSGATTGIGDGGRGSGGRAPVAGEGGIPPPTAPGDTPPRLLKKIEPEYPRIARIAGIEGIVILSLHIMETGLVSETRVIKSLGNTGCDEAATAAARQWRFAPALKQGKPANVWINAPIVFTLKN